MTQETANRSASTPSHTPRRKRLKVAVACVPCRRHKVKCDGSRPVCENCTKNDTAAECAYTKRSNGVDVSVYDDQPSLRNDHGYAPDSTQTNEINISTRGHSPSIDAQDLRMKNADAGLSRDATARGRLLPANQASSLESPVDSMNGVTGDPMQTHEVFGRSSAGSFMREIHAAIDARLDTSSPSIARGDTSTTVTKERSLDNQPSHAGHAQSTLFLLPPRGLADAFMKAYWDNNWSLYPIVNRHAVEMTYESLWTPGATVDAHPLMSIINICFALGCHYSHVLPANERRITGDDFFARAERLYERVADVPSCERVQCLLLFGIYLQSTSNVFQCWMTVGKAIRMAQSLGIHMNQSASHHEPEANRENRRRMWHGCIWLDRVLSATFGRPGMIPKWLFDSVPLPSMIDDEFFGTQSQGSAIRPDGQPCIMAFPAKAMELYQILDDVLVGLYLAPTKDDVLESKLAHILELDGKLHAWQKTLPGHLQTPSAAKGNPILERQAVVLRIRSLHVRVLLYRPVLVRYCKRGAPAFTGKAHELNDFSLSELMLAECSRICFRLAHELIDTFYDHLEPETLTGPLPIWWYSVLYVYTAATMILVERFLETKEGNASKESNACHTLNAALHVLRSYGVIADSPRRCVAALEVLSEKLSLDRDDKNTTSNNTSSNDMPALSSISEQSQGARDLDWDSFWGMSNMLRNGSGEESMDPELFSFNFEDFIWLNSLPGSSDGQGI